MRYIFIIPWLFSSTWIKPLSGQEFLSVLCSAVSSLLRTEPGTSQAHTQKYIYPMSKWKKSVLTICSTSWMQGNITWFLLLFKQFLLLQLRALPCSCLPLQTLSVKTQLQSLLFWKASSARSSPQVSCPPLNRHGIYCHLIINHCLACPSSAHLCRTTVYIFWGYLTYHF